MLPNSFGNTKGLRAAIYTRVSSEEQVDGYSLDAQREIVSAFAAQRGWQIVEIYEDAGRSGKTVYRPDFQRMLADAKAGCFDVIAVHKLDRFSRSLVDVFVTLKELDSYNVSFVSTTEDFDFTTPLGKVILAILAAFAQWYVDNLAAETRKGKKQRALSGDWNGTLSYGYTTLRRLRNQLLALGEEHRAGSIEQRDYSQQAGTIEDWLERYAHQHDTAAIPCPFTADGVRLGYRKYSTGQYSDNDIAWILNDAGYRINGKLFNKDTVRDMLQNRFYLGETSYKGKERGAERQQLEGKHEPLIDAELFEMCQAVRTRRAQNGRRNPYNRHEHYPLSQLLYCVECGTRMHAWTLRGERRYRDPALQMGRRCSVQVKSFPAVDLEQQVEELLFSIQLPKDWRKRALGDVPMEALPDERKKLEARLERLQKLFVMGDISEQDYYAMRDTIQRRLEKALPARVPQVRDFERMATILGDTKALWTQATAEEKQAWLSMLFEKFYVQDGRIIAAEATPLMWALIRRCFDIQVGDDGVRTRDLCLDRAVC